MTCPKCSHLVNPYSGQCQNIHCTYVRGQQEPVYVELTPSFDFGPTIGTCAGCGATVEVGLWRDHNGNTLCQDCFYAPIAVGIASATTTGRGMVAA